MKKIIFVSALIISMITVSGTMSVTSNSPSDIVLANIEALALYEGDSSTGDLKCYKTISTDGTGMLTHVTYCGDCKPAKANAWSSEWMCKE